MRLPVFVGGWSSFSHIHSANRSNSHEQAIDEFGFSVVHGLGIDDDGTLIGLVSNLLHGAVKHSDSSEELRGHFKKAATRALASLLMHKAVGAALALAAYLHLSSLFGFIGE